MQTGQSNKGHPVRCDCGKLIAYERNGVVYVLCKRCKREVQVTKEPRIHEDKSH